MTAWKSYPRAPAPGTPLMASDDLPPGATRSVEVGGFGVLLARAAAGLVAYVNACPHQYLPLDWRKAEVLSADGTVLRCSNHEAGFDAETGQGIDGFGEGCWLDPIPVVEADGRIRIDPAA